MHHAYFPTREPLDEPKDEGRPMGGLNVNVDTFRSLNPIIQALLATCFTWAMTALGAACTARAPRVVLGPGAAPCCPLPPLPPSLR